MDTETKDKIAAAAKMGYGAARCASAVALAFGHGLMAMAVKKPIIRSRIASILLEEGQKTFKEGLNDWQHLK